MTNPTQNLHTTLIDVADSVLVVIDVQDSFLSKLTPDQSEDILSRVGWLMDIANVLKVPIIATAEEIDRMGSLSASLAAKLPNDTPIFNKMIFGLVDNPEIFAALQATGRRTAVLVGLETDVCVAHSALGLLQKGYQVVAVADATASPGSAHEFGLQRMQGAGVLLTSLKSVYYEWIRTVHMSNVLGAEFRGEIGLPKGITL